MTDTLGQVHDSYGVLVGWSHQEFGGRLNLQLQSLTPGAGRAGSDVNSHHFLMTRNQALLLANHLLHVTGQSLPQRKGWLARWFGG